MVARIPHNPMMMLPVGTRIVLRGGLAARDSAAGQPAGAVGGIIKSPVDQRHSYRVRFPDGSEAPLRRTEFVLLKEVQAEAAGLRAAVIADFALREYVLRRRVVGSQVYRSALVNLDPCPTAMHGVPCVPQN